MRFFFISASNKAPRASEYEVFYFVRIIGI